MICFAKSSGLMPFLSDLRDIFTKFTLKLPKKKTFTPHELNVIFIPVVYKIFYARQYRRVFGLTFLNKWMRFTLYHNSRKKNNVCDIDFKPSSI